MTARTTDINGFTTITRNPISAVGVFPYLGRSIKAPPDQADKVFMVYRPESELSDPEVIESFKLQPWTNDHAMLGDPALQEGLINPEDKGIHGTLGEQVEYDPTTRQLYANLRIWSTKLAALIDGGKKELSCGFRCVYEFTQGNFEGQPYQAIQRRIRGNHLATVETGRMGPGVAVLDHLTFTFDAKEFAPMAKTTRRIATAKKLGVSVEALAAACGMDGADAPAMTKWNAVMDAEVDDKPKDGEGDGAASPTLADVAKMLEAVGPALAGINSAIAAIASGSAGGGGENPEDMEAVVDGQGQPVMDPSTGKPKMQKKAAPAAAAAVDAVPPAIAAMDASVATLKTTAAAIRAMLPKGAAVPAALMAMDAAISDAEKVLVKAKSPASVSTTAFDALETRLAAAEKALTDANTGNSFKNFAATVAKRDALYGKASAIIGAFDHAEMDATAVAKYSLDKLGLSATDGQEVTALEMYLAGRLTNPAPIASGFALDAGVKPDTAILDFLDGKTKAA